MRLVLALVAGTLFGAGLAFSGMMNPARVRGFLDIFGEWDPTLAFVMGGAVIVMAIAWAIQRRVLKQPIFDAEYHLPGKQDLTARLLLGSGLFGVGWGLAGLCPGPAIASLGNAFSPAFSFVAAMAAGMILYRLVPSRSSAG